MNQEQRLAVITEAKSWLGTPYHHRSRLRGVGVDCGTFCIEVYGRVGLLQVALPEYSEDWMKHRTDPILMRVIREYFDPVLAPETGDLALFKIGREVSHATIILDWPSVIHCSRPSGVITANAVRDIDIDRHRFAGYFTPRIS
jgi:cell wall-associated NlpC family hydrolase